MASCSPGLSRHVGVALWAAARAWRRQLTREMAARGVPWYGDARAALIPYIGLQGVRMADLPLRTGLSRQAVHQFIEALEDEGIVRREADPDDRRGRIVRYTAAGRAVIREADLAKRRIEEAWMERLGAEGFDALLEMLALLADDGVTPAAPAPSRQRRR